jgi:hypothetical protein
MREQYTLEIVTNVLKNPTGTTALPNRFFCALTSHIDNLQILRHLIVTHWTHPDTMVTIDDYAHQVSPDNILYIDYLRNPPLIPQDRLLEIKDRLETAFASYDDDYADIPTAAYTFIGACAVVILGAMVFQAVNPCLCEE